MLWSVPIVDYHGLSWIMDYHGLSWINNAYHGLWTIMNYCGVLSQIVDHCGLSNMHHHGIAWITRYAPQACNDTQKVWRRYGAYRSLHQRRTILLLLSMIVDYYDY